MAYVSLGTRIIPGADLVPEGIEASGLTVSGLSRNPLY